MEESAQGMRMFRLIVLAVVALLPVSACGPAGGDETVHTKRSANVTDIIPTSDYCNPGLKPGECTALPPTAPSALDHLKVDGNFSPLEYAHATQMDYTESVRRAHGSVFVEVARHRFSHNLPLPGGILFAYLQDIPLTSVTNAVVGGGSTFTLQLYVDSNRFVGHTFCFDSADRRYDLDFLHHKITAYRPGGTADSCERPHQGVGQSSAPGPGHAVRRVRLRGRSFDARSRAV